MGIGNIAVKMERTVGPISSVLNAVGTGVLFLLMVLTAADVSLRYFLNHPIPGVFELTELAMVVVVFFGLAYTASKRSHIAVDLVVARLPQRWQGVIDFITGLLSLGVFALIIWQSTLFALEALAYHEVSDILNIPTFYFKLLVPLGALILSFQLVVSLLESLGRTATR
jgi:TRAP-type C4-dicarboxylate transport system permease small subunit